MSILDWEAARFPLQFPLNGFFSSKEWVHQRASGSWVTRQLQVLKMCRKPRVVTESSAGKLDLERNSRLRQVKPALNTAMPLFVFLCLMSDYLFPGSTFVKGSVLHFPATFQWCGQPGLCLGWAKYEACWEPCDQFGRSCSFSGMFKKEAPLPSLNIPMVC